MRKRRLAFISLSVVGLVVSGVLLIISGRLRINTTTLLPPEAQTRQPRPSGRELAPSSEKVDDSTACGYLSTTPSQGYRFFLDSSLCYHFEYPIDESCNDMSCVTNKHGLRIEKIPYWHTRETWEETLKESTIYCAADGPLG